MELFSYDNWELILQFVFNVVDKLQVDTGDVRVGMVAYSQTAENIFFLNS